MFPRTPFRRLVTRSQKAPDSVCDAGAPQSFQEVLERVSIVAHFEPNSFCRGPPYQCFSVFSGSRLPEIFVPFGIHIRIPFRGERIASKVEPTSITSKRSSVYRPVAGFDAPGDLCVHWNHYVVFIPLGRQADITFVSCFPVQSAAEKVGKTYA